MIPRWLFSARQSLIGKCNDLSYFWVSMYPEAFLKCLLQRKYSLKEDVGWRIPRWLFSALSSLCVNGIIFANSESYMLPEAFHSVFTQENIWFERSWWKNTKMAVKGMAIFSVWMGLISYSESPYYQKSSIKFLNKRIYALEEDVGRRISRCLDSAWKSLMCEWGDFSYFWVSYCPKHSINFLIKRIYGSTDVGWRIPRWLFSARSS